MTDPGAVSATRFDVAEAFQAVMRGLDRWGRDAIPHGPIPPEDPTALAEARREAESAAVAADRLDALRALRHWIIEWALGHYREAGLQAVYFTGALEPPEQRRDAIEVVIDAATAYLLADVLRAETSATLAARFDVWIGGPLFGIESADD